MVVIAAHVQEDVLASEVGIVEWGEPGQVLWMLAMVLGSEVAQAAGPADCLDDGFHGCHCGLLPVTYSAMNIGIRRGDISRNASSSSTVTFMPCLRCVAVAEPDKHSCPCPFFHPFTFLSFSDIIIHVNAFLISASSMFLIDSASLHQ